MGGRRAADAAGTATDSPPGEPIPAPVSGSVGAGRWVRYRKRGVYLSAGALLLLVYALLVGIFGLHASTAHIAAAMTYTLAFLLAVALARAGARDRRQALIRTLIAGGIMLAPAFGDGVFALDLSVGHLGTAVPLLALWIVLDRADRTGVRRWQV